MAKKKIVEIVASPMMSWDQNWSDNNPDGVLNLPGEGTDPSETNKNGITNKSGKKMCFPSMLGETESPNKFGGVNTITANGVASSRGEGHNQDYNWGGNTGGIWNKNRGWGKGANRTGE